MKRISSRAVGVAMLAVLLGSGTCSGQLFPDTPQPQQQQQPQQQPQPQQGYQQPLAVPQSTSTQQQPAPPQQQSGQLPHAGNLPNAPQSNAFANLPVVTIREFRSSVPEIAARGATDMFITALVNTGKFRVVERARLSEGIAMEKALNQQGMTTGNVGQSKYVGAGYIFEATISGLSADVEKTSIGFGVGGLGAKRSNSKDVLAIDVRVIDVESGIVLQSIPVRKNILGEETSVGGVTTLLANLLTRGRSNTLTNILAPSDEVTSGRNDGVDTVLRVAIEEAVTEIARRFGSEPVRQVPVNATVSVPPPQ